MKKILILSIYIFMIVGISYAQTVLSNTDKHLMIDQIKKDVLDSLKTNSLNTNDQISEGLKISGYLETYYAYDFGNPANHTRPGFVYSHNRTNEINLNLGYVKLGYNTDIIRANLALMVGTYGNANLSAEPGILKNIYEANVGFKLAKTKNIWLDAGIFSSHIGSESAVSKDCWTLTRSILAENSPYFESGVKISSTSDDEKWFFSALLLNGWQRMQRIDGNNMPAFGHQLTYKPNAKVTLNSSSFIGSDSPDSTRQMRYFHNLYAIVQMSEKFSLILGFDIGAQQKSKESNDYNTWYSPVIIAKYSPTEKLSIGARAEYYNDANGVMISTGSANGFQTWGSSINLDYAINENLLWRTEVKNYTSKDKVFLKEGNPTNSNYIVSTSLAVSF